MSKLGALFDMASASMAHLGSSSNIEKLERFVKGILKKIPKGVNQRLLYSSV
ncbi:MAG: hypothetical protein LBH25_12190 [Fibromonadaceae bacterium]|jgi:hypothetical protein|nr:hypothetical protein [Fibromonadaceae bacterium]